MQSVFSKVALLSILLALCVNSQGLPFYFDPMGKLGNLPYDKEVLYLESTGTQYINTGITCNTVGVSFSWELYAQSVSNSSTAVFHWFIGDAVPFIMGGAYGDNTPQYTFYPSGTYVQNGVSFADFTLGQKYEPIYHYGTINGNSSYTNSLKLFARNENNGSVSSGGAKRIMYCKITSSGTLSRDFIPVRIGTTGYMYDKVSGSLFGNVGTGFFTLGADKP